eukprot:3319646-Amphidinium_carterae.1
MRTITMRLLWGTNKFCNRELLEACPDSSDSLLLTLSLVIAVVCMLAASFEMTSANVTMRLGKRRYMSERAVSFPGKPVQATRILFSRKNTLSCLQGGCLSSAGLSSISNICPPTLNFTVPVSMGPSADSAPRATVQERQQLVWQRPQTMFAKNIARNGK